MLSDQNSDQNFSTGMAKVGSYIFLFCLSYILCQFRKSWKYSRNL